MGTATARQDLQRRKRVGRDTESIPPEVVLRHWCREGFKYRGLDKTLSKKEKREYGKRVDYELGLMHDKDFDDYFLVLSDIVRTAKDRGLAVGPGRGSAAASLVCYLIRLTEVNPMKYPLMLFERFIDPNRFDLPDVDLDFDDVHRDLVRQIAIEKYGEDRVGWIGTFTRYRGKNSIDDVARVYQVPKAATEQVKDYIVERSGGDARFDASIQDTIEMFPEVKEVFDQYPELHNAEQLEGNYKSFGVHASGMVVGADSLWKYVATYSKAVGSGLHAKQLDVLSVDKYDGEHLGLLKLDALGLSTMGMIADALRMLDMSLDDLYDISTDDPDTLAAFERGDVMGIFQFEGRTTRMLTEQMRPKTFMDLAALNALSRPGPLHSGSTSDYLMIREGKMPREELHPIVTRICESTEGQIIYQEQILQICGDVGKLPWTHRSAIRKIISSKQGESAFNELWGEFWKGAEGQGIDKHTAEEIWKRMVTAGTYAFNIAHCISYSMLGFWAMWLKVHHPLEFFASQLNKVEGNDEKRLALMRDMTSEKFSRDIKVLPPKPGVSGITWTPDPDAGGVRAGFAQIPGIGPKTSVLVKEFDDSVGITEWADLASIRGIGPKSIDKIAAFADQPDPFGIQKMRDDITGIKAAIKSGEIPGLPYPKHNSEDVPYDVVKTKFVLVGLLKNTNLKDMFEDHRSRTGEELDREKIKRPELAASMTLYLEDIEGPITARIDRWLYPHVQSKIWKARKGLDYCVIVAEKYPFPGSKNLKIDKIWIIEADE